MLTNNKNSILKIMSSQKGLAPILIILIIALGIGGYLFYSGKFNSQPKQEVLFTPDSSPSTTNSQSEIPINYTLPQGWKEEIINPANKSSFEITQFISSDIQEDAIPKLTQGARIKILRYDHNINSTSTLKDEIKTHQPALPLKEDFIDDMTPVKIGGLDGLNKFVCWEGCFDTNYVIDGGFLWVFQFECAPNCNTKIKMDANKNAKDWDLFMNSIKFTGQT